MTIKELIELLQQLPQDSDVSVLRMYYNGTFENYDTDKIVILADENVNFVIVPETETQYAKYNLDLVNLEDLQ